VLTSASLCLPPDPFDRLLHGNKAFAHRTAESNPALLKQLAAGQSPEILWLGCADSRVPETTICSCQPGDIFVHRNIANILVPGDASSESVIEYAVVHLGVKRVVVCGHTGCGGAKAAMGEADLGSRLNGWLEPVRAIRRMHEEELGKLESVGAYIFHVGRVCGCMC